jgi:hypothetical protein
LFINILPLFQKFGTLTLTQNRQKSKDFLPILPNFFTILEDLRSFHPWAAAGSPPG